jgi:hypothetical protein
MVDVKNRSSKSVVLPHYAKYVRPNGRKPKTKAYGFGA